ncbi:arginine/serine-rich protein PNISR isoform X3 [Oreochromis niloticus]|uniref:arginine/serine-rich protein PNISR isoform X3 n=1 Tax=Oreochromis niloticus TaxID=8128 RepID=UPI0009057E4C|nr:arginine/serine-rich protein PNISR isoform X3 [Oreochromis niloticus]XP_039475339.1 arginine/serine-rich protein PNISR isoform X3 [Oreochromis aureus]
MWDQGGQPWPQWPLSQQQWMQSFQHQHDPGQVDWAALAQAWIAQKESTGGEQQNIQPNGQEIPGLESVGQNNHSNFQGDPAFGRMWQPEWGMHGQPPPPPPPEQAWIPPGSGPMDVVNPSEDSNSQDSVEFNSEAHHGVYPQNSHGMELPHPLRRHQQASTPHTGRVLLRTDEMPDRLGFETGQDPLSSSLSNLRPQQHH